MQRIGNLILALRELPHDDLKFIKRYIECILDNDYKEMLNDIIDEQLEIMKEDFE